MKKLIMLLIVYNLMHPPLFSQEGWFELVSGTNIDLTSICFVDQNDGWVVGFYGTILRTTDGGINWTLQTNPYPQNLYSVTFTDQNNGWAVGADGFILNTSNGGLNWSLQPSGTPRFLTGVYFTDNFTGWAVGGVGTLLNTTNGGTTWNLNYFGTSWLETIFFVDQNFGWIAGSDGTIVHTTDGGLNWFAQTSGITDWLYSIHFVDHDYGWAVGGWGVLIKTTDGGNNWINVQCSPLVFSRSTFFIDQNRGWIGGLYDPTFQGCILYTTDGGDYWSYQGINFGGMIRSICFINQNIGWAAGNNGTILKTTTGGIIPVELTSFTASVHKNKVTLCWSTSTETNNQGFEIERKSDGRWEKIGYMAGCGTTTEPKSYSFEDEEVSTGHYLYRLKQVDYNGNFKYSNVVEIVVDILPKEYALFQNYPNPFNPSTKISFSIPRKGIVTLKVYDALGIEVSTLVNEEKPIGTYELTWNAENLPSGVYFYQLRATPNGGQAGNYTSTKKMILLK